MKDWPVTISLPTGLMVGGVQTWAVQLARKLAEQGRKTRLVVHETAQGYDEVGCLPDHGAADAFDIVRAPSLKDPAAWDRCVRICRDLTPTLLLPNIWPESYALAAALAVADAERVRVVAWDHSDHSYEYAFLTYYEPIIHRYVAASRRCVAQLHQRVPTRTADIEHLPYGVFVPAERPRPPLSARPIRLAYAGRIEQANKRVFDLVALARLLDRRGVLFELRFVGDGPDANELRERITSAASRLSDHRNTLRHDPPVPHDERTDVWAWADVSLLASHYEGFNISMTESMACGCVPVVSRVRSGVTDIVREQHNGLTFPVGDLDAMADRIEWLARNEASMREMSRAARQTAEELCGYERYLTRVIEILDRAAAEPPRPWPPARTLHMNTPDWLSGVALPNDACRRLRNLLEYLAETDSGPAAIYGAGNHTRALAPLLADSPVPIAAIIDDDRRLEGCKLWGWPIVSPEAAYETGAKSVVISSWMHEADIWERQRESLEAAGLRVFRLYAELPRTPVFEPV